MGVLAFGMILAPQPGPQLAPDPGAQPSIVVPAKQPLALLLTLHLCSHCIVLALLPSALTPGVLHPVCRVPYLLVQGFHSSKPN